MAVVEVEEKKRSPRYDYDHQRYLDNRDAILEQTRQWQKDNPDKVKKIRERYRKKHAKRLKANYRDWAKRNPNKVKARRKRFRKKHRNRLNAENRAWREKNQSRVKEYQGIKYAAQNKPSFQTVFDAITLYGEYEKISPAIRKALDAFLKERLFELIFEALKLYERYEKIPDALRREFDFLLEEWLNEIRNDVTKISAYDSWRKQGFSKFEALVIALNVKNQKKSKDKEEMGLFLSNFPNGP